MVGKVEEAEVMTESTLVEPEPAAQSELLEESTISMEVPLKKRRGRGRKSGGVMGGGISISRSFWFFRE